MQGRHSALHIALDDSTRATLHGWLRQQKTPVAIPRWESLRDTITQELHKRCNAG